MPDTSNNLSGYYNGWSIIFRPDPTGSPNLYVLRLLSNDYDEVDKTVTISSSVSNLSTSSTYELYNNQLETNYAHKNVVLNTFESAGDGFKLNDSDRKPDSYYVGWKIRTYNPNGSGSISGYVGTTNIITQNTGVTLSSDTIYILYPPFQLSTNLPNNSDGYYNGWYIEYKNISGTKILGLINNYSSNNSIEIDDETNYDIPFVYSGSVTLYPPFRSTTNNTTLYELLPHLSGIGSYDSSNNQYNLSDEASSIDDYYNGINFNRYNGSGIINDYNASNKLVTIIWDDVKDRILNTSTSFYYHITEDSIPNTNSIKLDDLISEFRLNDKYTGVTDSNGDFVTANTKLPVKMINDFTIFESGIKYILKEPNDCVGNFTENSNSGKATLDDNCLRIKNYYLGWTIIASNGNTIEISKITSYDYKTKEITVPSLNSILTNSSKTTYTLIQKEHLHGKMTDELKLSRSAFLLKIIIKDGK